jgi:hypothetical protein
MSVIWFGSNLNNTYPGGSSTDNPGAGSIDWPGGAGWLVIAVGVSFSGGAFFQVRLTIDGGVTSATIDVPIPGLEHINSMSAPVIFPISAEPQVFPFSAPRGKIRGFIHVLASGDEGSNLSAFLIPMTGS